MSQHSDPHHKTLQAALSPLLREEPVLAAYVPARLSLNASLEGYDAPLPGKHDQSSRRTSSLIRASSSSFSVTYFLASRRVTCARVIEAITSDWIGVSLYVTSIFLRASARSCACWKILTIRSALAAPTINPSTMCRRSRALRKSN